MQIPRDMGRKTLSEFLRRGREARRMSLDEISRITRIPQRSLEKLEAGEFEALPADVFVRGFVRSYASCVGLDADEALRRYAACGRPTSPVADYASMRQATAALRAEAPEPPLAEGTPRPEVVARGSGTDAAAPVELEPSFEEAAREFDDDLPTHERTAPEALATLATSVDLRLRDLPAEPAAAMAPSGSTERAPVSIKSRRKRGKKKRGSRRIERAQAHGASGSRPLPAASELEPVAAEPAAAAEPADVIEPVAAVEPADVIEPVAVVESVAAAEPAAAPPADGNASRLVMPPRLVIDDDDPDVAEKALAEREIREKDARDESRRTFLPEILREPDQGTRRGTLTLAVIILVIVATLAMSYLLRRPSSSGDGVTLAPDGPAGSPAALVDRA